MKKISLSILVLLLIGGGAYIFINGGGQSGRVFEGEVTVVDLDPVAYDGPAFITLKNESGKEAVIAVPSMGLPLCAAFENITSPFDITVGDMVSVSGAVNEEGQVVPCEDEAHYLRAMSTASNTTLGYSFSYTKGPQGYVVVEDTGIKHTDFLGGILLFNKAEYAELLASDDAREGPPAIGLRVYNNPQKLSAFVWPDRHQQESNVHLAFGKPTEAIVGGANASHYLADGLYATDTYVIAHDSKIYVLTGAYLDQDSAIRTQFEDIVASFIFIP